MGCRDRNLGTDDGVPAGLGLLTLVEIAAEVRRLAAVIQAGPRTLPTFGNPRDDGHPCVQVDALGYHLIGWERAQEIARHTTTDLDDLLYRVFEGVTSELASDYEEAHPVAGQDFRRVWFARQVELLSRLSAAWGQRQAAEQEAILREHPFDDSDE